MPLALVLGGRVGVRSGPRGRNEPDRVAATSAATQQAATSNARVRRRPPAELDAPVGSAPGRVWSVPRLRAHGNPRGNPRRLRTMRFASDHARRSGPRPRAHGKPSLPRFGRGHLLRPDRRSMHYPFSKKHRTTVIVHVLNFVIGSYPPFTAACNTLRANINIGGVL